MTLKADTLDIAAILLDELDETLGTGSLRAVGLEVVVVVEELCVGIRFSRSLECDGNVGLPDGRVEYVLAVGTVVIQGCMTTQVSRAVRCGARRENEPSLTTSHCVQCPLYRSMSVVMWFCIISISVALSNSPPETQVGNCEYHTRV